MPYIDQDKRENLDAGYVPETPGELNYKLTKLCLEYLGYWDEKGMGTYWTLNDVIGVLEACKLELYRRRVAPYEDIKIKENGDVE